MKQRILELREQGKTYRQIREELGCSKGTISYHLGIGQKEKTTVRRKKYALSAKYVLNHKIDNFIGRNDGFVSTYTKRTDTNILAYNKLVLDSKCYLTGRDIDLSNGPSYSIDHINPYYISKDNSIDNMALACKDANQSKSYMTVEEYLSLCKEVLEYNGYTVLKH